MEVWLTLFAVILGLSAGLIGVALARMPRTSVAPPLYAFVGAGLLWGIGGLIADTAIDLASKQAGIAILYSGSITLPALWWMIALRWADEAGAELPFRSAAWTHVPLAFAGSMWLVMITNPWHGAFLTPIVGGHNIYQPFWYVIAIPSYGLILAALGVGLAVIHRSSLRETRRQGAVLVSASLVTLVGNAIYVGGLISVDTTPVVLAASGALLVVGMAREGLFGVMPWALPEIAANHPDGLIIVGPDGHTRFANARAHELLAPIDIRSSLSFVDILGDARFRPESSDLVEGAAGEPWATLTRDGGVLFRLEGDCPRWLHLSASVVRGLRGRTRGHYIRIIDLTSQREAELHARQTRRLDSIADLTRTLSRQFQGSFALVHNNAELLLADSGRGADSERKLGRIIEAAKYGSDLAQQLQLYTGSIDTRRVMLELSEVVGECCGLVETDLPAGVELVFTRSEELLPVHVDAIQLRHCIFDVLMNATESMTDADGAIRVWTGMRHVDPAREALVWGVDQPPGDFTYVRIRDEGGGMDREIEERAFEPYFSTREKDRGVGLPTVLGIARAHGALVELENEPGAGCTFTLYFPLERDPDTC